MTNIDLDRTDFEILDHLQKDARISNKALAAAVDLAPSSCHERLKRLRAAGILRGAHLEVDPGLFGYDIQALFFIGLAMHNREVVDAFLSDVVQIPEVRSAFLVTGRHDMVVHVLARDMQHLKDLALDKFTNRAGVQQIETSIIYEMARGAPVVPAGI